jgi:hypothetical protein
MEELKLLIDMVANLPQMALWVLVGFLVYKLAVVGSVYGVIRLGISSLHDWAIKRKELPSQKIRLVDEMYGICISDDVVKGDLMFQIKRVCGKNVGIESKYIHESSVDWLRSAIDDKIAKDMEQKAKAA